MEQGPLEEVREQAAAWAEAADAAGWAAIVRAQAQAEPVFVRVAVKERLISKEFLAIR